MLSCDVYLIIASGDNRFNNPTISPRTMTPSFNSFSTSLAVYAQSLSVSMEAWFIFLVSLCLCFFIKAFISLFFPSRSSPYRLPPGPPHIPIITELPWLRITAAEFEPILQNLLTKYGPIVALRLNSSPVIFIGDRNLAHQVLIQNGAVFADRPRAPPTSKVLTSNQHNISSASYGPMWRTLRRNLTSEILHPSRIKSFSVVRKWVLGVLLDRLRSDLKSSNSIKVIDHLHYAMFCLLVFMCFGEKVDERKIKEIEDSQRNLLVVPTPGRYNVLNFWPTITKILFRKRWEEILQLRMDEETVLIPLIKGRRKTMEDRVSKGKEEGMSSVRKDNDPNEFITSYVDTLLDLELPDDKRKLDEGEIVTLCSEFLTAGTDTTATALQWIMANLVKYPHTQQRLVEEIKEIVGDKEEDEVKERDLNQMPYLKAVVLEGLRRHPPAHFVLPHAVTEEVVLNDYLVPKNGIVNFMVAEMGWDPNVWEDPMSFKPERFLNSEKNGVESFDITGSKEIKMMPFGAGRRMCPGLNLAILHLEYFVANLVWNFEWKAPNGDDVDLSEKPEFTVVMKYPLLAHITPRI